MTMVFGNIGARICPLDKKLGWIRIETQTIIERTNKSFFSLKYLKFDRIKTVGLKTPKYTAHDATKL